VDAIEDRKPGDSCRGERAAAEIALYTRDEEKFEMLSD